MTRFPVITAVANVLAHAPGLVRYGSKPLRDLARDPGLGAGLAARLRGYATAVAYAPNQAYLGNRDPETLRALPSPRFSAPTRGHRATAPSATSSAKASCSVC